MWQLSQLSVACGKQRQGQQENMVDLSSSWFWNCKHTARPSYYHAPWIELSTGLFATWVWNSSSRRHLFSSHCGALAVMNSGSHTEHKMSRFHNFCHARENWGYMESQSPVHLTSLVLYPSGYIEQECECWTKFPWVSCVSWGSYFYEFQHKAIFLSKKSSWYEIILWLLSEFQAFILLPEINTYNYFLFF
jgi:hypothetical protein